MMELTGHSRQAAGRQSAWGRRGRTVVRAGFHRRSTWLEWLLLHSEVWSNFTSPPPYRAASSRSASSRPAAWSQRQLSLTRLHINRSREAQGDWPEREQLLNNRLHRKQTTPSRLPPTKCLVGGVNRFQVFKFLNFDNLNECSGNVITRVGKLISKLHTCHRNVHKQTLSASNVASRWLALARIGFACLTATLTLL